MPTSWGMTEHSISLVPLQELILHGPGAGYSVIKEGAANIFAVRKWFVALSIIASYGLETAPKATGIALVIEVMQSFCPLAVSAALMTYCGAFVGGLLGGAVGLRIQKRAVARRKLPAGVPQPATGPNIVLFTRHPRRNSWSVGGTLKGMRVFAARLRFQSVPGRFLRR